MGSPHLVIVLRNAKQWRPEIEEALGMSLSMRQFIEACPSGENTRTALRTAREAAEDSLNRARWVLAMGNEGLYVATGHSGIQKWRSRVIEENGYKAIATLHPAVVTMKPGYLNGWLSDIRFFMAQVKGTPGQIAEPSIFVVDTKAKLVSLAKVLRRAELLSYDIETTRASEFEPGASIVSIAGTIVVKGRVKVWALPLSHPQSPWRRSWRQVLLWLAPHLTRPPRQVAHNGKFDDRWLRHFGVPARVTFDTMLAAHLLDENRPKGLKRQATSRLGIAAWEISTKDLHSTPLRTVLKYNALDTYYTYFIYLQMREELQRRPRLLRIFKLLMMPANDILTDVERRGIWIDREKLATHTKIGFDTRDHIDQQLMEWVPDIELTQGSLSHSPWPTNAKGKPAPVNFNASNFARWWLFEWLRLPVIRCGKAGAPSMAEDVMMELRGAHPVVDLLLERAKWQKYCSAFLTAYNDIVDENDRIHTTFKLTGTVTGRLSSGKADEDKITAKVPRRGVNLQQVPRDPFIRGLFGAPPGWTFVEADFSQIELRVVAFLSRDRTMLHLYQTGQDIHTATASWVMGKPASEVTKEDRKKAKAVNFGFVYGMGARKFVKTAFEKYELRFTEDEAKQIRKTFFRQFKGLQPWHNRQRRLVNHHARVQSPIGRIRHLPDIRSGDDKVQGEAERQAINSPVQSFASDMTLLSMILIHQHIVDRKIQAHVLGLIHDAVIFECKDEDLATFLPIVKRTMENLPLKSKFGVELDVPIEADIQVGKYWGEGVELTARQVWEGNIYGDAR